MPNVLSNDFSANWGHVMSSDEVSMLLAVCSLPHDFFLHPFFFISPDTSTTLLSRSHNNLRNKAMKMTHVSSACMQAPVVASGDVERG